MTTSEEWKGIAILGFRIFTTLGIAFSTIVSIRADRRSLENRDKIELHEDRLAMRELIAKQYIPRLEATELLAKNHEAMMQRILDRQTEIRHMLENRSTPKAKPVQP